jgi:hypothetical protein
LAASKTAAKEQEITIRHKDVAKMLMPRQDLHRFAGVLGIDDPDAFWQGRDPKLADVSPVLNICSKYHMHSTINLRLAFLKLVCVVCDFFY